MLPDKPLFFYKCNSCWKLFTSEHKKNILSKIIKKVKCPHCGSKDVEAESHEYKFKSVLNNIEKLNHSINDCYDENIHEIKVKLRDLLTKISDIIDANSDVKERTKTKNYTVKVKKDGLLSGVARGLGLGGYREEERIRNVSYAFVQDAIEQINKIIKYSQKIIDEESKNIFDIEAFYDNITDKLIEVFDLSDLDFESDSITLPLEKAFSSMNISEIKLNKDYTDIIIKETSNKKQTSVKVMKEAINETTAYILKDIKKALDSEISRIVSKLDEQKNNLIKDISSSIEKDIEELKKQLKENKKIRRVV